ncbi:MAG TPA: hypothetical protein PLG59_16635 [bacterium]|nr:hypothetical protein [bacterium]
MISTRLVCFGICLFLLFESFAQAQDPTDILDYGDAWVLDTFYAKAVKANIDGATVSDAANNFAQKNMEWILAYLATLAAEAEISGGSSNIIVAASEAVVIGTDYFYWEMENWDNPDSVTYGVRFAQGGPIARLGQDSELTPYTLPLPGVQVGSHRGFRVNLAVDYFTTAETVRILAILEQIDSDAPTWASLSESERVNRLWLQNDPINKRMGPSAFRMR